MKFNNQMNSCYLSQYNFNLYREIDPSVSHDGMAVGFTTTYAISAYHH
jgi:hypothetical protein